MVSELPGEQITQPDLDKPLVLILDDAVTLLMYLKDELDLHVSEINGFEVMEAYLSRFPLVQVGDAFVP